VPLRPAHLGALSPRNIFAQSRPFLSPARRRSGNRSVVSLLVAAHESSGVRISREARIPD